MWQSIARSPPRYPLLVCSPRAFFCSESAKFDSPIVADVTEICRVLSDHRGAHHDIESALAVFSRKLSSDVVDQVLKRCKNLGLSAHRFFLWATKLQGFDHRTTSYHILVDILGNCKEFPLIWDLLWEMRDGRREITFEIFRIISRSYSRADLPADALRAFKKMREFGIKPGIEDFHHLLINLSHNSFMKEAREALDTWKSDFDVCPKTYSILMKGWGDSGNPEEARKLFDEMREKLTPDVISFNSLMECLCRAGRIDEAYSLFQEMKHLGFKPVLAAMCIHSRCV